MISCVNENIHVRDFTKNKDSYLVIVLTRVHDEFVLADK